MKLTMATIYRSAPQLITMYFDSPTMREVIEYRRFDPRRGRKETRRLADYDPVKNRWMTDLGARYDDLPEGKRQLDKLWAELEAQIETSDLVKDRNNSSWVVSYYYARPEK